MSSTSYLDPNGDASIAWGVTPSSSKIDDGIRQPTTTGFDGVHINATASDDNLENVYDLTNPVNASDTVSALKIWLYLSTSEDFGFRVRLKIAGNWAPQSAELGTSGWVSYTYSPVSGVSGSDLDARTAWHCHTRHNRQRRQIARLKQLMWK